MDSSGTEKSLRLLLIEDSEDDAWLLRRALERGGYSLIFERVDNAEAMHDALNREAWSIVVSDHQMPRFSSLEALKLLQSRGLDLPFIIVSGTIGEDVAVSAMKAGAHDYLMKGNLARLLPVIERELREADIRPGAADWQPVALLPLLAAVFYAAGVTLTRWRCRHEANFALSAVHNSIYIAVGILGLAFVPSLPWPEETRTDWPFLTGGWLPLTAYALALMLFTAGTHLVGVLCSVRAYQLEDASRIAPFEYVYLIIMPVYDILFWGQWPQPLTLLGMALICGGGVFVAWREGRPARPQVHPRGEEPWTPDPEHADKGA
jgi:CheY-like chemotaxis protein